MTRRSSFEIAGSVRARPAVPLTRWTLCAFARSTTGASVTPHLDEYTPFDVLAKQRSALGHSRHLALSIASAGAHQKILGSCTE